MPRATPDARHERAVRAIMTARVTRWLATKLSPRAPLARTLTRPERLAAQRAKRRATNRRCDARATARHQADAAFRAQWQGVVDQMPLLKGSR